MKLSDAPEAITLPDGRKFWANYDVSKDDLFFQIYDSDNPNQVYKKLFFQLYGSDNINRVYIKDLIYYLKLSGYFKPIAREFIKAYEESEN